MNHLLVELSHRRIYWIGLVMVGCALEAAALYYQHVLGEWPCLLCIHVRIWIMVFILLGLIAIFCTQWLGISRLLHGLAMVSMIGLLERSWQVLGVERGWVFGDCSMDLGMPAWLALDKWLPALFEVETACGYTPLIFFNLSMAEILLVVSALLLIMSAALFIASWFDNI